MSVEFAPLLLEPAYRRVAAAIGEIDESKMQGGLAGRHRERADTAFELGDALLEHGGSGIGDAAVAEAVGFEIEQRGAMVGAVERIGDGLIDRHRHGPGGRLDLVSAVDCDRLDFHRGT